MTTDPRAALAAIVYRVNNPHHGDYDGHVATADAILAAGWRPPLPEVMHDAGETADEAVRRLAAEVVGLRQQLAALPDSETEWQWGTRDRHGQVHWVGVENEAQARSMLSMTPVRRPVGPWEVVDRG